MTEKPVYFVRHLAAEIAEQNARIRELIARASEVLKLPKPDTFLGRKTQEPFPNEDPVPLVTSLESLEPRNL
ncbi:hypothetical protein [Bradyrhizobium sp. Gha]|uniref:hypothetical protein n=1 Tax=Bradyrhizobium sp. Gha TaxID=1855318 RepID=UPI0008E34701|nr:hypothetical protein [Bradyrhizobium sp. Gha]SFI16332.1 hypothetical protein SAMN05216525_10585 [Bradyrhizobium sp. Gha]